MSHHLFDCFIKFSVIAYVLSRHMHALGFPFQLFSQLLRLLLLLIRQGVQPLEYLVGIHMGKAHLELPGNILQVQV